MSKKRISRFERLQMEMPTEKYYVCVEQVDKIVQVAGSDGILEKSVERKTIDPSVVLNSYKANDFALENVIASGSTNLLQPVSSLPVNDLDNACAAADRLVDLANQIETSKSSDNE